MGGNAFTKPGPDGEPPLTTPRLDPSSYDAVKRDIEAVLMQFYERVLSPKDGLEKADYGDIDFLVQGKRKPFETSELSLATTATRTIKRNNVASFAIPLAVYSLPDDHAQVDVQECFGNIDWLGFLHAYGDLWQILGKSLGYHGLTANDRGLHLRFADIENKDWKRSMMFLSQDPRKVLDFLGLDADIYERGFQTEDQIFDWLSYCRLLSSEAYYNLESADDKRRLKTRQMFQTWCETRAPKLPATTEDRATVSEEAAIFFGRKDDFDQRCAEARKEALTDHARLCMRRVLNSTEMSDAKINMTIRAFFRWVDVDQGQLSLRSEPQMQPDKQLHPLDILDDRQARLRPDVSDWIESHFEAIKSLEKRRLKLEKEQRQSKEPGPKRTIDEVDDAESRISSRTT